MWPALILAVNRKAKIIGRAETLVISTISKNQFNQPGAPLGRRLAIKEDVFHLIADKIKDNHKGRARDKVNKICELILKT